MSGNFETQAEEIIESIEKIMGRYPGHRRAHARGHVYKGEFVPSERAAEYSHSLLFNQKKTSTIVRFSHSSPDPTMADALSPIKGMAVKCLLPQGEEINLVAATVAIFVTKEPQAFLEMIRIGRTMKKGKPRLSSMVKLFRKFPDSRAALKLYRKIQAPSSFALGIYHTIHTFYLVNEEGGLQPVKFTWEPENNHTVSENNNQTLEEELDKRLSQEQITFNLVAKLGTEDDPMDDPTVEWPEKREKINLGKLTIQEKLVENEENFLFDPTVTGKGIKCSEDKILQFRKSVYSISHEKRVNQK